jgi:ATP adenylyltransferase
MAKNKQGKYMEIKFTPWRMAYITSADSSPQGCVLCDKGRSTNFAADFVLYRGTSCYIIMNLYPYNTGHLMVTPYAHTADLPGLEKDTAAELFALTRKAVGLLHQGLSPHGFNVGMNLGRTAGAGIDEHLHMHIVPRWNGDANFMPVVGGTKLVPEALEQTYSKLRPLFESLDATAL